ncbi:M12 family metallo-peptidase [Acanthopleuribacter pedis]|uniref:Uncharacterized protein n=1 Tax=Acanthopleuribacter pedis TaxID=442870 RepID=A0A8J7Q6M1_9BACT|nr:M12 family metallo-peptidase [Acanthopleuribacter pedis]MBO1317689.1 hypothetical protein [Acanthopleuribacter pedis]
MTLKKSVLLFFVLPALAFGQPVDIPLDAVDSEQAKRSFRTVDPFGNDVEIFVDPPLKFQKDEPWFDADSEHFIGYNEVDEYEKFPADDERMKRAVTVNVYVVADEEYRARHSDWQQRLEQIIETADNSYWRDFRINWVIQGYYSWTSNGNNASAILADLARDAASLPNGLIMGFSADSRFDAGGIAYVYRSNPRKGFSVCLDQGVSGTTSALRHEIGHNYGCSHDFDPVVCLMNYTYSYQIDYFDSAHDALIQNRDSWFR